MIDKEIIQPIINTLIGSNIKTLPNTLKKYDIVRYNGNLYKCIKDGTYSIVDSNNFKAAGIRFQSEPYEVQLEKTIESLYGRIYERGLNGHYKGDYRGSSRNTRIYYFENNQFINYKASDIRDRESALNSSRFQNFKNKINEMLIQKNPNLRNSELVNNIQSFIINNNITDFFTSYGIESYEVLYSQLDNIGPYATRYFLENENYEYGVYNKTTYHNISLPTLPVDVISRSWEEKDGERKNYYYGMKLTQEVDTGVLIKGKNSWGEDRYYERLTRFWLPYIPFVEKQPRLPGDGTGVLHRATFHSENNYGIYLTLKKDGKYELYFDVVYTNCERIEDQQWGDMYAYVPAIRLGVKNTAGQNEDQYLKWQNNDINKYKLSFTLNGTKFSDVKVDRLSGNTPNFSGNAQHFNHIKEQDVNSRDPMGNFISYVTRNLKYHEQTIFIPVLYCVAGAFKKGWWDIWHPFIFAHIIPPFNLKYLGD